jgi:hypothetical protein
MNRRNQILSGLVVLQLIIIAVIFWPGRGVDAAAERLFGDVTLDDIQAITVQQGEQRVHVARSGDGWVLPEAGDFPVTALTATDTISKVLQLNTQRLVASNAGSHARLQVTEADAVRKVDLETTDGETLTLFVGSSPSFRATNVRRANSDAVYLTNSLQATDLKTDYGSWIDTMYLAIPQSDVTALTVTNGQGTLNFTKVSTDTWTLSDLAEGEIFNQNNLTTLLTRASGFNMVQPLGTEVQPAYGMENPAATMTVEWQNAEGAAQSTTLTVGAQPLESGNYAVKSSDSAYYVEAAEFSVENLINRGRSDYLQEPEVSDTPALDGTTGITATNFISGFETVTETTVLTATGALTSTETVTP